HREFPALAALDPSGTIAHAALLRGFGGVMLYGALGVWMLAALSALAFHGGSRRPAVACASRP
ncbi:MFS transporter, partial [Variovorax sp. CT11-76]